MSKSIPIILALTLLIPGITIADDDTGFYIGIAGNRLYANFDDVDDLSFDDSDTAASIKTSLRLVSSMNRAPRGSRA